MRRSALIASTVVAVALLIALLRGPPMAEDKRRPEPSPDHPASPVAAPIVAVPVAAPMVARPRVVAATPLENSVTDWFSTSRDYQEDDRAAVLDAQLAALIARGPPVVAELERRLNDLAPDQLNDRAAALF